MKQNSKIENLFLLSIVILISLPAVLPFFRKGYFPTHDGEWAVVRLADMYRTVKDLQIPARVSAYLNSAYGYPLFNFAYPFPYYLGLGFLFLGFGFVSSIKILFVLSVPLSAFFMFLVARKLWKNDFSGIVSALFYIYFPYRFVDLYVRGSIGESLSFVLFPLILFLVYKIKEKPLNLTFISLSALAFGTLIMTHNIMAVIFTPVLLIYALVLFLQEKDKQFVFTFLLSLLMGVFVSAFFWFPALFEKNLIKLSQVPIADRNLYFVSLKQLIVPSWGYEPPTEKGGFTYNLGLAHLLVFLSSLISLIFFKLKKQFILAKVFILITIITLILMFKETALIWRIIPLLSEINYPWTMLSQIGLLLSLLAGFLVSLNKPLKYFTWGIAVLALIQVLPYAKPQYFVNRGEEFYSTNQATTTSSDELMPLWVKEKPDRMWIAKVETIPWTEISNLQYNSRKVTFNLNIKEATTVTINILFYPGWEIKVNNNKQDINYKNKYGVIEFSINNPGEKNIKAEFKETPSRQIANLVSLFTFSIIILIFFKTLFNLLFRNIKRK